MQYINLSEVVHVLKAVAIVTRVHLNISLIFTISHFLIAKVSPEWRLNPGFGTKKKCLSSLNRGVPSIEDQICAPEWSCPFNKGVQKERFLCLHVVYYNIIRTD